jgi:hypothetical protein
MMAKKKPPTRVREPVQVYLDARDRELLERLVAATGLPRAELIRRGIRRLASEAVTERAPGWALDVLLGSIPDGPEDLAAGHDDYLAEGEE